MKKGKEKHFLMAFSTQTIIIELVFHKKVFIDRQFLNKYWNKKIFELKNIRKHSIEIYKNRNT